ncbi:uncharacterized protein EI97DRAFT_429047 [Westerdykella ornata]|uniref:Uncharacterized protein n=1 Tax=Westerdykella ornata TaxID=318751 RepID=A0A6A6JYX6_WESOR|nr:uncharacterized protein EI97DRAFT_429047 [Westerdykella ornata]KAF2280956.1 hypothetical protein EI97DRAFT_429047 [Westerdykella ornata]
MQQEELARLFSANLTLSQHLPQDIEPCGKQQFAEKPSPQQADVPISSPITYASTHYTHSYHVAPVRQAPLVGEKTSRSASELRSILISNSIDPSLLFPSQIDLFTNADDDQRVRLLELWRISPPSGRQGIPEGVDYSLSRQLYDWPPTSLAQEEAMAKLRYERMMQERAQSEDVQRYEQELDRSMVAESKPSPVQEHAAAEPYIVSGYEMLAMREYEKSALSAERHLHESTRYNQATDPVYIQTGTNGGRWEKHVGSIIEMENQYGAFAQARDHDVQPIYMDDEMVM